MQKYHSKISFIIGGELPSLNEYINAERANRYLGSSMKKNSTGWVNDSIMIELLKDYKLRSEMPIRVPVFIEYHWYCKNKKKDKDNVAFAKKFINDALQESGVLLQDNWKAIDGFSDHFYVDAKKPHIEVIIKY